MSKKNKNVSSEIPAGRIIQTRDEYFEGAKNYRKPGYEKKGLYRGSLVVDSNRKGDLALVKLTTSEKGKAIPGVKKSKYRPYVQTLDDTKNPIKVGKKFKETKKQLSKNTVAKIKKDIFHDSLRAIKNRRKVRKMKGRQKK